MRKLCKIWFICILLPVVCIFAPGCIIDDSAPALMFEDASQVDILVFRCGDAYLTYEEENVEWLAAYGEIPADISLEDGEYAYVNADIARVTGGSSYYTGNPEFKKVNSFQKVSLEDLVNDGKLTAYDPDQKPFYGIGYYVSDKATYCIAQYNGTFYVYEDNDCTGVYHTKDDMVNALEIN